MNRLLAVLGCCFCQIGVLFASSVEIVSAEKRVMCKTISEAARRAKPGDTIYVGAGVYRESVRVPAGKADAPISLVASGEGMPTISGADAVKGVWKKDKNGFFYTKWAKPTQIVLVDGELLVQVGQFLQLTPVGFKPPSKVIAGDESQLVPGSFYWDKGKERLWVRLKDDSNPASHQIEVSVRSVGVVLSSYTHMKGFEVAYNQTGAEGEGDGILLQGKGIELVDCISHHNDFSGIYPQGHDITILRCESSWNGNNGFTSNLGVGIKLVGCESQGNNTRGYDMAWHGGGLKFVQQRGLLIDGHTAESEAMGIWLDINCLDSQVSNSIFKGCEVGIYFEISRWGVLANNTFRDCQRGIWSYSSDVLIAHNAFERCGQGVVVTGDPRYAEYYLGLEDSGGKSANTLAAIRNNAIVNNLFVNSKLVNVAIWSDSPSCGGHLSDHNVFVSTDAGCQGVKDFSFWSDWGAGVGWEKWKQRGMDENSVFCFPKGGGEAQTVALVLPEGSEVIFDDAAKFPKVGCAVGEELIRLPADGKYPWKLLVGSEIKAGDQDVKFENLWFSEWQPLPPIGRISDFGAGISIAVGVNPSWKRCEDVPKFASEEH